MPRQRTTRSSTSTPGGSGITRSVVSANTNITAGSASNTDYVYLLTGNITLTLPTAVGNTNRYTLKSVSGIPTIACNGAQQIDGTATIQIASEDSVDLVSSGTEWNVI